MTADNAPTGDTPLFSALLTPHRSLSGSGFVVLMAIVAAVSFAAGIVFLAMGAWPVFGFFGLDVALIYWAFRANYRSARAYEQVTVTATALTVRQVSARGRVAEWTVNPLWARLERENDDDFGLQRLTLVASGQRLTIGSFLAPNERESFAGALSAALAEARRGPRFAVAQV